MNSFDKNYVYIPECLSIKLLYFSRKITRPGFVTIKPRKRFLGQMTLLPYIMGSNGNTNNQFRLQAILSSRFHLAHSKMVDVSTMLSVLNEHFHSFVHSSSLSFVLSFVLSFFLSFFLSSCMSFIIPLPHPLGILCPDMAFKLSIQ